MRRFDLALTVFALAAAPALSAAPKPLPGAAPRAGAMRPLAMRPAARLVIPFTLTRSVPTFTYQFTPPAGGTYTAAANWESSAALKITVSVGGAGRHYSETGRAPLGVAFQAQQGDKCAIAVGPAAAPVETKGELALLAGSGEQVRKRLPPTVQGMANGLARLEGKDALLPIIVRLAERHLANAPDRNDLDRAFEAALARHPRVSRELLSRFVNDFEALPQAVKEKAFVPEALQLPRGAPVSAAVARSAVVAAHPALRMATARPAQPAAPHIHEVRPAPGPQGYLAGQELTIIGSGFAPQAGDNIVEYWREVPPADRITFGGSQAYARTDDSITFRIPPTQATGTYYMRVYLRSTTPLVVSNHVQVRIYCPPAPPKPKPLITRINPAGQQPGATVSIIGQNFQPGKTHWVIMTPVPAATETALEPQARQLRETAQVESATQLRFQIPRRAVPGDYNLTVDIVAADTPQSDPFPYQVAAPHYRVTFEQIKCIDESNPEWWGDDEVVTFWGVTADESVWSKNTGQYGNMADGVIRDYRPQDRSVFPLDGSWGPVRHRLVIVTKLYEWDWGDVSAAQEFVGFINDVAAALSFSADPLLAGLIEVTAEVISSLIDLVATWFGGDPDHLGTVQRAWTAPALQDMLEPGESTTGGMNFLNDGDTGSYYIQYTIQRQ